MSPSPLLLIQFVDVVVVAFLQTACDIIAEVSALRTKPDAILLERKRRGQRSRNPRGGEISRALLLDFEELIALLLDFEERIALFVAGF